MPENYVIDDDTTDEFLDVPLPTYGPDAKSLDEIIAERRAAGHKPINVPPLPPPPDDN